MTEWLTPETRDLLADGLMVTVVLTLITSVASFVVGVAVGTLRLTDNRVLRYSAGGFIEVFRNIPALIQIIFCCNRALVKIIKWAQCIIIKSL